MGKIIGICNQKGGTGKTTTVVNLSSFLALDKQNILVIDLDPQGNTTSGLGLDRANTDCSVYEVLSNQVSPKRAIFHTKIPYLSIMPADASLAGAEIELAQAEKREYFLKKITTSLKEEFDFILIDAPPSLGVLTINILAAVDSVIIPVQCEYYALEGLSRLTHTLELIKEELNPTLEIEGIVFTMADFRTRLTFGVMDEVKKFFPDKVYRTIIPRNVRLSESPSFGKPIYFYAPFSPGSRAYYNLTCEILNKKIKGVYDEKTSIRKRIRGAYTQERTPAGDERIQLY
jgi:chromosome partitioning protein